MNCGKLENPERIRELNPADTLKRIGLKDGDAFCDIGAGTGIFVFAAAAQTGSSVYAVDTSGDILDLMQEKRKKQSAENVILKKCRGCSLRFLSGRVALHGSA